jgi:protein phosphatase 1E
MEDKHVVISDLNALFGLDEYPYQAFFAIYDGHGGVEAAEYARNHLHVNVVYSEHFATDPEQALRAAFAQTDIDFLAHARRENLTSGCTCIVALVRGDTLYTAWLGDSQAMLCRDNTPVPDICRPHKPERDVCESFYS